jgi:hypothetical protein
MAKKIDAVHSEIYSTFLNGGRRRNAAVASQVAHERMYLRVLTELAANRFEWTGLPDSIDVRFLEWNLTYRALAVFYKDEDTGKFLAVQGAGAGHTNFLDQPVRFTVIGPGIGAGHAKTPPPVEGMEPEGDAKNEDKTEEKDVT